MRPTTFTICGALAMFSLLTALGIALHHETAPQIQPVRHAIPGE